MASEEQGEKVKEFPRRRQADSIQDSSGENKELMNEAPHSWGQGTFVHPAKPSTSMIRYNPKRFADLSSRHHWRCVTTLCVPIGLDVCLSIRRRAQTGHLAMRLANWISSFELLDFRILQRHHHTYTPLDWTPPPPETILQTSRRNSFLGRRRRVGALAFLSHFHFLSASQCILLLSTDY